MSLDATPTLPMWDRHGHEDEQIDWITDATVALAIVGMFDGPKCCEPIDDDTPWYLADGAWDHLPTGTYVYIWSVPVGHFRDTGIDGWVWIDDGERSVVYIGMTNNVPGRLRDHWKTWARFMRPYPGYTGYPASPDACNELQVTVLGPFSRDLAHRIELGLIENTGAWANIERLAE